MKNPAANTKPLLFKAQPELLRREDIVDIFLYDTTRDTDGGRWREKFRSDTGRTNWLETQIERTMFPSTVLIVTSSTDTVIYDATIPVQEDNTQPFHSEWAKLYGPIPVGGRSKVTAANGMIFVQGRSGAQTDARTLYAFDLITGHVFRLTSDGVALLHGGRTPQQWEDQYEMWSARDIDTSYTLPDAEPYYLIAQPVFVGGDRVRGVERPTLAMMYADQAVTVNPDMTISDWTDGTYDTIGSVSLGRDGTLAIVAGSGGPNKSTFVFTPDNRLRYLGSSAFSTQCDWVDTVVWAAGATTKVVVTDVEHIAIIRDDAVSLVGIHGNGFEHQRLGTGRNALTMYGSLGAALLAGDTTTPEEDFIWGTDWTLNGALNYLSAMPGAETRLWNGWTDANYLEKTGNPAALAPASANWLISGLVRMDDLMTGERTIIEYGYAPSTYSGSAIKVSVINNVLTLTITDDGYATTDVVADVDALPDGVPVHFAAMRYGSELLLFRDGILVDHGTVTNASGSLSNGSAVWRIGLANDDTEPAFALSIGHIGICKPDYTELDVMRRGFLRDTALANKGETPYLYTPDGEDVGLIDAVYEPLIGEWYVLSTYGVQTTDGSVVTGIMYSRDFGFDQDTAPNSFKLSNEGCRVAVMTDYRVWLYGGMTFFDRSQFDQLFADLYSPAEAEPRTYRAKTTNNTTKPIIFIPIEPGSRKRFKVVVEVSQPWDVASAEEAKIEFEYVATRPWSGSVTLTEMSSQRTIFGSGLTVTSTAHQRGVYLDITGKVGTVLDWLIKLDVSC